MKHSKKILFIINGLGLGNYSRSFPIVSKLIEDGHQVAVCTSGKTYKILENETDLSDLHELKRLEYPVKDSKIAIFYSFKTILSIFRKYLDNRKLVKDLLKKRSFDLIITDSDYTLFLARKSIPQFAINNSKSVVDFFKQNRTYPNEIKSQLLIEKLDYLYHRFFVDRVFVPSLTKEKDENNFYHVNPPIRKELHSQKSAHDKAINILVMLSTSGIYKDLNFIDKLVKIPNTRVNVISDCVILGVETYPISSRNSDLISKTHILITNSGLSSLSEAHFLKIPTITIPIKNHAEQYANAHIARDIGLAHIATSEKDVIDKTKFLIENYKTITDAQPEINNGTEEVYKLIMEYLND